jgi:hypothetical protein
MQHKGYMCFDFNKNKMHISRQVVFYDHIFPFRELNNLEQIESSQGQHDLWV